VQLVDDGVPVPERIARASWQLHVTISVDERR